MAGKPQDLRGKRFGKLAVLKDVGRIHGGVLIARFVAVSCFWLLCSPAIGQISRVYTYDAKLLDDGCSKYSLLTAHYWYARPNGKYDFSKIDLPTVKMRFEAVANSSNDSDLFLLNIEEFSISDRCDSREVYKYQLRPAVEIIRDLMPQKRLGWYRMIPERTYWGITEEPEQEWKVRSRRNMELYGHLFDYCAPSIYEFYASTPDLKPNWHGTIERWEEYAKINIALAKEWGKPCYPVIMPFVHNKPQFVTEAKWRAMLTVCRDNADGVMLFTGTNPDIYEAGYDWRAMVLEIFGEAE